MPKVQRKPVYIIYWKRLFINNTDSLCLLFQHEKREPAGAKLSAVDDVTTLIGAQQLACQQMPFSLHETMMQHKFVVYRVATHLSTHPPAEAIAWRRCRRWTKQSVWLSVGRPCAT
jgi:hypothetical protein